MVKNDKRPHILQLKPSAILRRAILFSSNSDGLGDDEVDQARLRFYGGGLATLVGYALANSTGLFGELREAIIAIAVYTFFAYFWFWIVYHKVFYDRFRRRFAIVTDEVIFCWGIAFAGGQLAIRLWMPIAMSVGNGLRFGASDAYFNAAIAAICIAVAFVFSPFWMSIAYGIAAGIAIAMFVIPTYAVSLSLRLQRL